MKSQLPRAPTLFRRHPLAAFLYAVPIAVLGGLIGLGGAEFRLPVLAGALRYSVKQAVPLNLAVSLITLVSSLVIRWRTLSFSAVLPLLTGIGAMITGAMITAVVGVRIASGLSKTHLERVILVLLVTIGTALLIEGFLPQEAQGLLPQSQLWQAAGGLLFGFAIGFASSLLGVAGGELIIPTLVFAFGAEIKTAGTASALISIPTVFVGIVSYAQRGAFADRQAFKETVAPMSIGSVLGALLGGMLVGSLPASTLKMLLGIILIFSAIRIFLHANHEKGT